jgi:hypothetical protein
MSTPPTSTPWVPMAPTPASPQVPPLVNGKWAKAEGDALVWRDIPGYSIPDTSWHIVGAAGEIPWENGWGDWPDGNYSPARYRRLSDGFVVLEGLIGYTGTQGATAFTLPVGWRPKDQVTGGTAIRHHLTAANYLPPWGTFWVYSDGRVMPEHPGAVYWLSLNNIRFYAGG